MTDTPMPDWVLLEAAKRCERDYQAASAIEAGEHLK